MPSEIDGMAGFYMALILRCRWRIAGGGVAGGGVCFALTTGVGIIGRHAIREGEISTVSAQTGRVFAELHRLLGCVFTVAWAVSYGACRDARIPRQL